MNTLPYNAKYPFCTLLILDGWGEGAISKYNAIKQAHTPHIDYLSTHAYHTFLQAAGEAVGLPQGTIGNSEVGHLNIGAGKVVIQEVLTIQQDIHNGKFSQNKVLREGILHAQENNKKIHLVGLISNALVHSSITHLYALLKLCSDLGIHENVFIHAITDGRDSDIDSGYAYINALNEQIAQYRTGCIATVSGRYYAMDRDQRWDRIARAYQAMIAEPNETPMYATALEGLRMSYNRGIMDEFIEPFRVAIDKNPLTGLVTQGDTIIFFNFREDRARQLTHAFVDKTFTYFPRSMQAPYFITMTEYEKGLCNHIAYFKDPVNYPISYVVSQQNAMQFKIAETEKYAHVTYFFNGGSETEFPLEDRFLIPSLKIPTYDLDPRMRVYEITEELLKRIASHKYLFLVANFANADMVGHSGNMQATIAACEHVDTCVGKVMDMVLHHEGLLIVTADHGNAEEKYDMQKQEVLTRHTTNPVPFWAISKQITHEHMLPLGKLGDIAPTILNALGLERSPDMSGTNLLQFV